jgi:hypothetical protein
MQRRRIRLHPCCHLRKSPRTKVRLQVLDRFDRVLKLGERSGATCGGAESGAGCVADALAGARVACLDGLVTAFALRSFSDARADVARRSALRRAAAELIHGAPLSTLPDSQGGYDLVIRPSLIIITVVSDHHHHHHRLSRFVIIVFCSRFGFRRSQLGVMAVQRTFAVVVGHARAALDVCRCWHSCHRRRGLYCRSWFVSSERYLCNRLIW